MSEFRKYGTNPEMDKLVDSKDWSDRCEAVRQNYGFDKLIDDESIYVRMTLVYQNYGLDKFINDEDWHVRAAVAERGYGLNNLINDKDFYVRNTVNDYLKKHNYKSISDWAKANPDKIYNDCDANLKLQEDLKEFIYKIEESSKLKVKTSCASIEDFFDNYLDGNSDKITIHTIDTKISLIKIQKISKNNIVSFKLIVDFTTEDDDKFSIRTNITSQEQLKSKIQDIIESLRLHTEFYKYADDLEECL